MTEHLRFSKSSQLPPWSAELVPDGATGGRLRILSTTDLHGQILSYDYLSNRTLFGTGLAQLASVIAEARAAVEPSLLFDNGDFMQGTALTELAAQAHRKRRPHPAVIAFETLGYDAVSLGNHEFNFGLELIERTMANSPIPMLSANTWHHKPQSDAPTEHFALPTVILERQITLPGRAPQTLRIGVLGLTPPETAIWERHHLQGLLQIGDMIEAARHWVPELRRQGADLVICLAHGGVAVPGRVDPPESCVNALTKIAGIDAVIAGHSHFAFPAAEIDSDHEVDALNGTINQVPVVQPGHSGTHLGMIDLWIDHDAATGWHVTASRSLLINGSEAVSGLAAPKIRAAEEPLREALRKDHRAALSWMRKSLGETTQPITSYFASIADSWTTRMTGEAMIAHIRRMPKFKKLGDLPLIAMVTPFRTGGRGGPMNYTDIAQGEITLRNVFDIYPFPNTAVVTRHTAGTLLHRLERSSARLAQIPAGAEDVPIFDKSLPGFSFEIAVGLDYVIDLTKPARPGASRIAALYYQGRKLDPDEPVLMVSNNYLANRFSEELPELLLDTGLRCTELLTGYIRNHGPLMPRSGPRWQVHGPAGATAIMESGINALAHIGEIAALRPEPLGLTATGFQRFRLHF